jgi:hypothetical protein
MSAAAGASAPPRPPPRSVTRTEVACLVHAYLAGEGFHRAAEAFRADAAELLAPVHAVRGARCRALTSRAARHENPQLWWREPRAARSPLRVRCDRARGLCEHTRRAACVRRGGARRKSAPCVAPPPRARPLALSIHLAARSRH